MDIGIVYSKLIIRAKVLKNKENYFFKYLINLD